jgi:hypothetical protein
LLLVHSFLGVGVVRPYAPPDVANWSSKHKRGKHTIGASEEFHRRPLPATTSTPPHSLTPAHGPLRRCVHNSAITCCSSTGILNFASPSTNILAVTASLPTPPPPLNRKYGSGQVGAYAGVGAHWYVLPQFHARSLFIQALPSNSRALNRLTHSVNRVSRPLLQPRPPRNFRLHHSPGNTNWSMEMS